MIRSVIGNSSQLAARALRGGADIARLTFRSQQISWVISRYAVAEGLAAIGISVGRRGLSALGAPKATETLDAVYGKKLAKTLVKLGPSFIKLGQMLALRPDLVGVPVAEELRVLFDRVPPVPFREIKRILKRELGTKTLKKSFIEINSKPLASASLAQVHQATLHDGSPVILKVQKPGTERTVRLDLILLDRISKSVDSFFPAMGIRQMFQDFQTATLREIDYREEAKNIDRFQKNFRRYISDPEVVFPDYYGDLLTQKVIVLQPMAGRKIVDLNPGTTVARKAASQGVAAILEQVFDHGFFHADPHAGNLFFMEEEGTIGFIDLGLVGQLAPGDRQKFLRVLMAILKRDRTRLASALFEMGENSSDADYATFESGVNKILDSLQGQDLAKARLDKIVNDLLKTARANGVFVPNRYVMMLRSFLIIEGVAKRLDPNLSLFKLAPPIVARSLMKSYNPFRYFKR